MTIKNIIDPMGLLSEPTSAEIKEWENSPYLSDNYWKPELPEGGEPGAAPIGNMTGL